MGIENFIILSAILFCIGLYGALTSQNFIKLLMSIELLLNAANINFIAFANFFDGVELEGHIFALFVMTLAAAETGIGLSIILTSYRNSSSIKLQDFEKLKW